MIRIDLIRHGEPDWAPEGVFVQDSALSDLGRKQAACLRGLYSADDPVELFVSPLVRARETATPISEATGQEAEVLPWLEELRISGWDGKSAEDASTQWAHMRGRDFEHWDKLSDEGETFTEFLGRVGSGLDGFLKERLGLTFETRGGHRLYSVPTEDRHVAMVAHAGTIGCLISHMLDLPATPWVYEQFRSVHASVTTLTTSTIAGGAIWSLVKLSDTRHLDGVDTTH